MTAPAGAVGNALFSGAVLGLDEVSIERNERSPTRVVDGTQDPDVPAGTVIPKELNLDLIRGSAWPGQLVGERLGGYSTDKVRLGLFAELREFLFDQRGRFLAVHRPALFQHSRGPNAQGERHTSTQVVGSAVRAA